MSSRTEGLLHDDTNVVARCNCMCSSIVAIGNHESVGSKCVKGMQGGSRLWHVATRVARSML